MWRPLSAAQNKSRSNSSSGGMQDAAVTHVYESVLPILVLFLTRLDMRLPFRALSHHPRDQHCVGVKHESAKLTEGVACILFGWASRSDDRSGFEGSTHGSLLSTCGSRACVKSMSKSDVTKPRRKYATFAVPSCVIEYVEKKLQEMSMKMIKTH